MILIFFLVVIQSSLDVKNQLESFEKGFLTSLCFNLRNDGNNYFEIYNSNVGSATDEFRNLILEALQITNKQERIDFLQKSNFQRICKENAKFVCEFLIFREFGLYMTKLSGIFISSDTINRIISCDFLYSKVNAERELVSLISQQKNSGMKLKTSEMNASTSCEGNSKMIAMAYENNILTNKNEDEMEMKFLSKSILENINISTSNEKDMGIKMKIIEASMFENIVEEVKMENIRQDEIQFVISKDYKISDSEVKHMSDLIYDEKSELEINIRENDLSIEKRSDLTTKMHIKKVNTSMNIFKEEMDVESSIENIDGIDCTSFSTTIKHM